MPRSADEPAPPLWRDPVLSGTVVGAVLVLGWLACGPGTARQHLLLSAVVMPLLDVLLTVLSAQAARLPGLDRPARRFWWALALAGVAFGVGDTHQLVLTLLDPAMDTVAPGAVQNVAGLIGPAVLVVLGVCYPIGSRSRGARLRVLLDAAIVNSAAAVVAWCLMTRPSLAHAPAGILVTAVVGCGLLLVGVYIAMRLGLTGAGPMCAAAALPLVAGAGLQGLAIAVLASDEAGVRGGLHLVLLVAPCFAAALTPRIQILRGGRVGPVTPRAQRRYSLLPYAATAVTAVTLVVVLALNGLGLQSWGALAGLLITVSLVIGRQVLALAENAGLLAEIGKREQRFESLMRHSSDITTITGPGGVFRYLSPAIEAVLGVSPAAALGRPMHELMHPDDRVRHAAALAALWQAPGESVTFQARFAHVGGGWRWLEVIAVNLTAEAGIDGVVSNARDVTEARELQERLRHQAEHDALTGLANRRRFTDRMRAAAPGDAAVLLIDLNGFKQINDTYGHAAGDAVLVSVAGRLRACLRAGDLPARLGGDEFAVLLGDGADAAGHEVADRFRAALAGPVRFRGHDLTVGASVGFAAGPADDPDRLLHAADLRMYEDKQQSRVSAS